MGCTQSPIKQNEGLEKLKSKSGCDETGEEKHAGSPGWQGVRHEPMEGDRSMGRKLTCALGAVGSHMW